jgi:hypothetical protein
MAAIAPQNKLSFIIRLQDRRRKDSGQLYRAISETFQAFG